MIFFDAHVHIYGCIPLYKYLHIAYQNIWTYAKKLNTENNFTAFLLLSESKKYNYFSELSCGANNIDIGTWNIFPNLDEYTIKISDNTTKELFLVAGRQVITKENLEVLALFTTENFEDGLPVHQLISIIKDKKAIPVLPWGVGKWFGSRGKIVDKLMEENRDSKFLLGDNRGRPAFGFYPPLLKKAKKKGIPILSGTDVLPFPSSIKRIGSYGNFIDTSIEIKNPGHFLKELILIPNTNINKYGVLENMSMFLYNQLKLRLG